MNVQCCVTVSASNFQVLTRISGGARRALGNIIVRFLAGPALYAGDLFFFFNRNKILRKNRGFVVSNWFGYGDGLDNLELT